MQSITEALLACHGHSPHASSPPHEALALARAGQPAQPPPSAQETALLMDTFCCAISAAMHALASWAPRAAGEREHLPLLLAALRSAGRLARLALVSLPAENRAGAVAGGAETMRRCAHTPLLCRWVIVYIFLPLAQRELALARAGGAGAGAEVPLGALPFCTLACCVGARGCASDTLGVLESQLALQPLCDAVRRHACCLRPAVRLARYLARGDGGASLRLQASGLAAAFRARAGGASARRMRALVAEGWDPGRSGGLAGSLSDWASDDEGQGWQADLPELAQAAHAAIEGAAAPLLEAAGRVAAEAAAEAAMAALLAEEAAAKPKPRRAKAAKTGGPPPPPAAAAPASSSGGSEGEGEEEQLLSLARRKTGPPAKAAARATAAREPPPRKTLAPAAAPPPAASPAAASAATSPRGRPGEAYRHKQELCTLFASPAGCQRAVCTFAHGVADLALSRREAARAQAPAAQPPAPPPALAAAAGRGAKAQGARAQATKAAAARPRTPPLQHKLPQAPPAQPPRRQAPPASPQKQQPQAQAQKVQPPAVPLPLPAAKPQPLPAAKPQPQQAQQAPQRPQPPAARKPPLADASQTPPHSPLLRRPPPPAPPALPPPADAAPPATAPALLSGWGGSCGACSDPWCRGAAAHGTAGLLSALPRLSLFMPPAAAAPQAGGREARAREDEHDALLWEASTAFRA